jgi:heat shock protein HslJ
VFVAACDDESTRDASLTETGTALTSATSVTSVTSEATDTAQSTDSDLLAAIEGKGFCLAALVSNGESMPIFHPLSEAGLSFGVDRKLRGHTGINRFDQSVGPEDAEEIGYSILDGRLVVHRGISVTSLGVAGLDANAAMNQETLFLRTLSSSPRLTLQGTTLVLAGEFQQALLIEGGTPTESNLPLQETSWVGHTYFSDASTRQLRIGDGGLMGSIAFHGNETNGTWEGFDGCNLGSGTYSILGEVLSFHGVSFGETACPSPLAEESSMLYRRVVTEGRSVTITRTHHSLRLETGDDAILFDTWLRP